ncbi:MAG: hypothetical protein AB3N06_04630 [Erythrobacter sp.]
MTKGIVVELPMKFHHLAAIAGASFLSMSPALAQEGSTLSDEGLLAEALAPASDEEVATAEATIEEEESGGTKGIGALLGSLFGDDEGMSEEDISAAIERASAYPLGSERNPVRVDGPAGERAYLSRLRCDNLKRPKFERLGSGGMSPFGGIVDIYRVECKGGQPAQTTVFMDMYHGDHDEDRPVPGFGIVGGRKAR